MAKQGDIKLTIKYEGKWKNSAERKEVQETQTQTSTVVVRIIYC